MVNEIGSVTKQYFLNSSKNLGRENSFQSQHFYVTELEKKYQETKQKMTNKQTNKCMGALLDDCSKNMQPKFQQIGLNNTLNNKTP